MDTLGVYSNKAEKYARYRWDYARQAIEEIFQRTGLGAESVVADIGAGTGILTLHFCGRVKQVFAIEPNHAMLFEAARRLTQYSEARLLEAAAEAIPLQSHTVDLITAAHSIHWFKPQAARQEFLRILKPGGWLALLRNIPTGDPQLAREMNKILTAEYGVQQVHSAPANDTSPEYYYGHKDVYRAVFPFSYEQNWEEYFGSLCSASFIPDESHPLFPRFEEAAYRIYHRFCNPHDGKHLVSGETELILGSPG